jgi:MtN3 and saliva related transmembrane protein
VSVAALGLIAGALTTGAWLPQLHRTWRRRSTDDISWPYLATFSSGIVSWMFYGVVVGDIPLLLANGITLLLLTGLIGLKACAAPHHPIGQPEQGEERPISCALRS